MKKLNILRAMQERGINKATLCKRTGLATQNINSVIDGNPTVAKLTQVAEGIGCDITELFFEQTLSCPQEAYSPTSTAPSTGGEGSPTWGGVNGGGDKLPMPPQQTFSRADGLLNTEGAMAGFFVFGGKKFKIVECE